MSDFSQNFHFLRPTWLLLLIPVGLLMLLMLFAHKEQDAWKRSIAAHLLPYLMIKGSDRFQLVPRTILTLFLIVGILGVAGPTWKQIEKPGSKAQAVLVIALDLSLSMLAQDIQPNRLERGKQKISDLLNANPAARTALVAYAGTAHLVTPFTDDYGTIHHHLESLVPRIIPVMGTRVSAAYDLADSLIQQAGVPGTLLLLTDDITPDDILHIEAIPDTSRLNIHYLLIATPNGSPIPGRKKGTFLKDKNGVTVVPGMSQATIQQAGAFKNVNVTLITLDDSDVKIVAETIRRNIEFELAQDDDQSNWQDSGYCAVFPIVLIVLLWFRRGWMVEWCFIFMIPFLAGCSDTTFTDLWLTRDQQGQQLYDAGEFDAAAARFESPIWTGMSFYEAGDYRRASLEFAKIQSPWSWYNLGLAQVQLGNLHAAVDAFDLALNMMPNYQEAIDNKRIVLDYIEKYKVKPLERLEGQLNESGTPERSEELDQQPQGDEEEEESGQGGESSGGIEQAQNEEDYVPGEGSQDQDMQNLKETMLRKMSNDPSEFLRRKFQYQYHLKKQPRPPEQSW